MTLPYILARRRFSFSRQLTLPLLVLNAGMGVLMFVQGCLSCTRADVRHIMLGLACVFLGTIVLASEFIHIAVMRMYASFLYSFCGRGLFYLAIGCISVDTKAAELGIAITLVIVGVAFLTTSLMPRIHFDDPEDHYAAAIYNIQHGIYATQQMPQTGSARGAISAPISNPSIGAYPPSQGIGNSSFGPSVTSFIPHHTTSKYASSLASSQMRSAVSEKPPRI
ncbi:hypothetical protein IW140_002653 [Coemansia sp. RSA 1813]|nr:hypothetical protein EV178_000270 [Coemansia sp. RSA 1646]KAJ1772084.1 hypothetical protein LPJ74_001820 [Coemansia sp. RSA 1843]KAJ2090422.1 hypothetical protein IW138_002633 [Coemansia sp. RSA 986]KAJ2215388.1 hypothetical protein EV179_002172 [Coemansia sp. RSA 487]KAJ2569977.1 hypothetical protein IW140_002653 [Coemansia sp. RSA 1813]